MICLVLLDILLGELRFRFTFSLCVEHRRSVSVLGDIIIFINFITIICSIIETVVALQSIAIR